MIEEKTEICNAEAEDGSYSLTPEERETIISWTDEDKNKIFIYSSQQPIIRRLLKNPLFVCQRKTRNKAYRNYPEPISVEGLLPRKCLTIRTKIRKLTPDQRKEAVERLKKARERQKPHVDAEDWN